MPMVKQSVIDVYSEIAKSNPPWTSKEEREFISSCTTKTGRWRSDAAKERFVNEAMKHNIGLAFSIVNKVAFNRRSEDVIQKAIVGMVEALKKYDPQKGLRISTWINNPIRWAVMQYQGPYAKNGTVAEDIYALNHRFHTDMSVVSIDIAVGGDECGESIGDCISLESLDGDYALGRRYMDEREMVAKRDIVDGMNEMVEQLSNLLNDREMRVIRGALRGKNQTEIAKEMKLSKVRVSQLQASAFTKIRNSPMAEYLRRLLK